jgi:hypothetical protein
MRTQTLISACPKWGNYEEKLHGVSAITRNETQTAQFTGEELQVKLLADSEENSLKY